MEAALPTMSPTALIRQAYGSFHPDSVPALARANYRRELAGALFFPVALAAVEGAVIGVVVKNAYAGQVSAVLLAFVVGFLAAAPELANVASFVWAALSHGRNKIRFLVWLQAVVVLMVAVVGLAPRTAGGLVLLAVAVVVARVCMAGVFMLRATLWGQNYARRDRARITGKFSTIQVTVIAGVALLLGLTQDMGAEYFRVILLAASALGAVGVVCYARVRVRGHGKLLRRERGGEKGERPTLHPMSPLRVLKQDAAYRRFMTAMFLLGAGNLMLIAPLTLTLADDFGMGALQSMIIVSSLPYLVIPFAIPFWSRLMSTRHVVGFRAVHSWTFVVSQTIVLIAAVTRTVELMYVGAVVQGIGFAGGSLAWNLGHLDFAPPHRAAEYMGVHVTLTGIRGLIAPVLAVSIYEGLRHTWPGAEHGVFGLSVVLCVLGALSFMRLHRGMRVPREEPPVVTPGKDSPRRAA
jgi:MFS family permease